MTNLGDSVFVHANSVVQGVDIAPGFMVPAGSAIVDSKQVESLLTVVEAEVEQIRKVVQVNINQINGYNNI